MSNPGPGAQPVVVYADGAPVSSLNPLPTTGGGGGGGGSVDLIKVGGVPIALGATTKSASLPVALATDTGALAVTAASLPLPTGAATDAKQDTGNTSLASIDGKVATETTLSAMKTLLGAGLPAALVGGKLDVNLGASSITLPVSFGAGTPTISSVNCTSAATLFANNSSAKARYIYNPIGNGTLYVRLGSGTHTGVSTSSFFVEGGQFVRIYPLDFTGIVQGILAAGSQTIQATEVA